MICFDHTGWKVQRPVQSNLNARTLETWFDVESSIDVALGRLTANEIALHGRKSSTELKRIYLPVESDVLAKDRLVDIVNGQMWEVLTVDDPMGQGIYLEVDVERTPDEIDQSIVRMSEDFETSVGIFDSGTGDGTEALSTEQRRDGSQSLKVTAVTTHRAIGAFDVAAMTAGALMHASVWCYVSSGLPENVSLSHTVLPVDTALATISDKWHKLETFMTPAAVIGGNFWLTVGISGLGGTAYFDDFKVL